MKDTYIKKSILMAIIIERDKNAIYGRRFESEDETRRRKKG